MCKLKKGTSEFSISASLEMTYENNKIYAKEILDKVLKEKHYEIKYNDYNLESVDDKGKKSLQLHPMKGYEVIDPNVKSDHNIYFILDSNGKKILYVGKSQKIRNRLTNHLVKCSSTTSSKIKNISEYMSKHGTSLKYYSIKVKPKKLYGAVEGMLIAYIKNNEALDTDNWNDRED